MLPLTQIIDELVLKQSSDALTLCDWKRSHKLSFHLSKVPVCTDDTIISEAKEQLREYLESRRTSFTVPLKLCGTDFQLSVWNALLQIPYGKTLTYSALAARLGMSHSVRAVANAVAANPISIFIPCHRVVAAKNLGGYAGGSEMKKILLDLEHN